VRTQLPAICVPRYATLLANLCPRVAIGRCPRVSLECEVDHEYWPRFSPPRLQHEVIVVHDLGEVLGPVGDGDVRAEFANPGGIGPADSRRHGRTEVLCELDRDRTDPARAGVNEHLLPGLHVAAFHERLPRGQGNRAARRPPPCWLKKA
jgi:hypothetical protein